MSIKKKSVSNGNSSLKLSDNKHPLPLAPLLCLSRSSKERNCISSYQIPQMKKKIFDMFFFLGFWQGQDKGAKNNSNISVHASVLCKKKKACGMKSVYGSSKFDSSYIHFRSEHYNKKTERCFLEQGKQNLIIDCYHITNITWMTYFEC